MFPSNEQILSYIRNRKADAKGSIAHFYHVPTMPMYGIKSFPYMDADDVQNNFDLQNHFAKCGLAPPALNLNLDGLYYITHTAQVRYYDSFRSKQEVKEYKVQHGYHYLCTAVKWLVGEVWSDAHLRNWGLYNGRAAIIDFDDWAYDVSQVENIGRRAKSFGRFKYKGVA